MKILKFFVLIVLSSLAVVACQKNELETENTEGVDSEIIDAPDLSKTVEIDNGIGELEERGTEVFKITGMSFDPLYAAPNVTCGKFGGLPRMVDGVPFIIRGVGFGTNQDSLKVSAIIDKVEYKDVLTFQPGSFEFLGMNDTMCEFLFMHPFQETLKAGKIKFRLNKNLKKTNSADQITGYVNRNRYITIGCVGSRGEHVFGTAKWEITTRKGSYPDGAGSQIDSTYVPAVGDCLKRSSGDEWQGYVNAVTAAATTKDANRKKVEVFERNQRCKAELRRKVYYVAGLSSAVKYPPKSGETAYTYFIR